MNSKTQTLALAVIMILIFAEARQVYANTMFESAVKTDIFSSQDINNTQHKNLSIMTITLTENFYYLSNESLYPQGGFKELTFRSDAGSFLKDQIIPWHMICQLDLAKNIQPKVEENFYSICKVGKQVKTILELTDA